MRIKKKKIIKIAIDSPAAAGAGTLARKISNNYNLYYLDTGKIYRFIAYLKIKNPKKFNNIFIKKEIKKLKVKDLNKKRFSGQRFSELLRLASRSFTPVNTAGGAGFGHFHGG